MLAEDFLLLVVQCTAEPAAYVLFETAEDENEKGVTLP